MRVGGGGWSKCPQTRLARGRNGAAEGAAAAAAADVGAAEMTTDWRDAAAAAANVLRRLPRRETLLVPLPWPWPLALPLLPPPLVGETKPCECG